MLLEVSSDETLDQSVALAAAVQLGKFVQMHWKFHSREQAEKITEPGSYIIISEYDKNHVRTNLISRMFQNDNVPIGKQYIRVLTKICHYDYPEKWPTLLNDISMALQSENDKGVATGCIALYCLVQKFEYEIDDIWDMLVKIM